jgi:hypothetical protein
VEAEMTKAIVSRLWFLSICLWALITVAQAADRPSPYLKGVTTVEYTGILATEGRCTIDRKAWDAAIDFVANQSSKLQLVRFAVHQKQLDEMAESIRKAIETMYKQNTWTDEDFRKSGEADAIFRKQINAPTLIFTIAIIEIEGGCVAMVEADVRTTLKSSEMISTGTIVATPSYSIWSQAWKLKKTYQSFSSRLRKNEQKC